MKTRLVLLFVIAALLTAAPAAAKEAGKFGVGFTTGYSWFTGDSTAIDKTGNRWDVEFDPYYHVGLGVTYWPLDIFSLEFDASYFRPPMDFKLPGVAEIRAGDLRLIPVLLTARYHPFQFERLSPYIGLGIDYCFNSFDTSIQYEDATGDRIDVDNSVGFHIAVGSEFFLTEKVTFEFDLRYAWTELKFHSQNDPTLHFEVDGGGAITRFGFKYYF